MKMSGFEHSLRNLCGVASAYRVDIILSYDGISFSKEGVTCPPVPIASVATQNSLETAIQDFIAKCKERSS